MYPCFKSLPEYNLTKKFRGLTALTGTFIFFHFMGKSCVRKFLIHFVLLFPLKFVLTNLAVQIETNHVVCLANQLKPWHLS